LIIVLKHKTKEHVLDDPIPDEPDDDVSIAVKNPTIGQEMTL
jgi:hypothetical protein